MGADRKVTLASEGRLAAHPLAATLGGLGLVRATGLLDVTRKRLVRRFVLDAGHLQAVVSNAREDRFLDWLLAREIPGLELKQLAALVPPLEGRPLTAQAVAASGLFSVERLCGLQREHLVELLRETAGWSDATFAIQPGRVPLGAEPPVGLSAIEAALVLAREETARARRPLPLPGGVVALIPPDDDRAHPFATLERATLAACASPVDPSTLGGRVAGASYAELQPALATLWRAGLLVQAERPEIPEDDSALTLDALERWLRAAATEDFAALLGVAPGADPGEVRRAYYRTVRSYHPDRFRGGPFADRHQEVEQAFRLVHDALEVLSDPRARAEREARRRGTAGGPPRDPAQVAAAQFAKAGASLAAGRRAEALEALEKAVIAHPAEPRYHLHAALLMLGNPARRRDAVDRLAALVQQYPGRADLIAALAVGQARLGQTAESQTTLRRALALDAAQPIARALSGDAGALAAAKADPYLSLIF